MFDDELARLSASLSAPQTPSSAESDDLSDILTKATNAARDALERDQWPHASEFQADTPFSTLDLIEQWLVATAVESVTGAIADTVVMNAVSLTDLVTRSTSARNA
ncbi:MAG: hypothetical protein SPI12_05685 [Actinomycetaceae bacterium]|nr:hypothetical protein [Actinomycetaceae bacterium]MDY6083330.1 hypothetical protein [Actinomycetaceae bacterium]